MSFYIKLDSLLQYKSLKIFYIISFSFMQICTFFHLVLFLDVTLVSNKIYEFIL